MSDSTEAFETIAEAAGFHDFDVSGNGCYVDDFLQHFYAGWKASRQALVSCEPAMYTYPELAGDLEGQPEGTATMIPVTRHAGDTDLTSPLYTHPASADVPDIAHGAINEACWEFVKAMPHSLPGPIFNDLKPAIYETIKHYHEQVICSPESADGSGAGDRVHNCRLSRAMDGTCMSCGSKQEGA